MRKKFLLFFVALILPGAVRAYNNTSLQWRTIETEHFAVHFHQGAEWTAREVARVAEEVYPYITAVYHYEPDGVVHFIIRDTDDYANGATYYYDNKIEIWATNLEFGFRGTSRWIENVVTHEFTHLVSLQSGFKFGRRFPALYFQMIDFEREKRPDVLTGYPSNILSYPFAGTVIPPWFAEGVAQYQSQAKRYDCWDTHRDMILRCAVLEGKMLSYDEMCFFGHGGMGNEKVYDHGYGMVRFIAEHYGEEALDEIVRTSRLWYRLNFDGALKKVTGMSGKELYLAWKEDLEERYRRQARAIEGGLREGIPFAEGGYMTVSPAWSPDGSQVAYLSNRGSDYSSTALYIMERDGGKPKRIASGVTSAPSFSPDGKRIVYAKRHRVDRYGSQVNDLYVYDLEKKKEKRLTHGLRASDPSFAPDGRRILCVLNGDGTHRLAILDGDRVEVVYAPGKGTQIYSPSFLPDGKRIVMGIFKGWTRNILILGENKYIVAPFLAGPFDERDPKLAGGSIVFASDRTGVFNIYRIDLATEQIEQLTNVAGGAFSPDVNPRDGSLLYAGFHGDGYRIELLEAPEPLAQMSMEEYRDVPGNRECSFLSRDEGIKSTIEEIGGEGSEKPAGWERAARAVVRGEGTSSSLMGNGGRTGSVHILGARDQEGYREHSYSPSFVPFQFYPRFVIYDRTARVGFVASSTEILDRQNLYVSASLGFNKEFDAYLAYELRMFYPTLFAEGVRLREYFDDRVDDPPGYWDLGLRYDLWEFDMGLRFELENIYSLTDRREISLFFTHGEYSVHLKAWNYEGGKLREYGSGGWKYYIGNGITARYYRKKITRAVDSDINPRGGREFTLRYTRSFDKLFTSGQFKYGFQPDFDKDYFNLLSVDWREYVALPSWRHTLVLRLYAAAIDRKVDDFFYNYVGGRDYARGYTYYSIGGRNALLGSVTYRFPIWRNINRQLAHLYFRDLYGAVFFDGATAWKGRKIPTHGYKQSLGFELRFSLGSYYSYPTALSIQAAYALDQVRVSDLSGSVVFAGLPEVVHDRGWSTYMTLGFGF